MYLWIEMKHVTWEIKRSRAKTLATARWINPEGEISFLKVIDVITNKHFEFYCMETLLPLKGGKTVECIKQLGWAQGWERWSQEEQRCSVLRPWSWEDPAWEVDWPRGSVKGEMEGDTGVQKDCVRRNTLSSKPTARSGCQDFWRSKGQQAWILFPFKRFFSLKNCLLGVVLLLFFLHPNQHFSSILFS